MPVHVPLMIAVHAPLVAGKGLPTQRPAEFAGQRQGCSTPASVVPVAHVSLVPVDATQFEAMLHTGEHSSVFVPIDGAFAREKRRPVVAAHWTIQPTLYPLLEGGRDSQEAISKRRKLASE